MAKGYYSTKEAATIIGASAPSVRNYSQSYARYLSTEATPPPGEPRRFTETDLKLLAFIYRQTVENSLTHDQVKALLEDGQLDDFEWGLEEALQEAPEQREETGTAVVPAERLHTALTLLEETRNREAQAREEAKSAREAATEEVREAREAAERLHERIEQLQHELGEAKGELGAYQKMAKRSGWWARLFGGPNNER